MHHYFFARVIDGPGVAVGPGFQESNRGTYEVEHVDLRNGEALAGADLASAALKAFIRTNRKAPLAEA